MASRTTRGRRPERLSRPLRARRRSASKCYGEYTYTLETIIAAGRKNMAVTSVPIRTNPDLRPSRLIHSLPDYVLRSALTILRSFATYKPLRLFASVGLVLCAAGGALGLRYLYLTQVGEGAGHVQSVILGALLISMGVLTGLIGIVADLIAVNRRLLEKLLNLQQAGPRESALPSAPPGRPQVIGRL